MMGVPYYFLDLLCIHIHTLCLCCHGRDPYLMTSLDTFTTPPLPPGTTLLPPLNANTHVGILPACKLSNLMRSQNANIDNLVNERFTMLPEMDAFGDGKILGEGGVANQTNSAPLFPMGLSMTSLPAEVDGTLEGTVSEGTKGGQYFPLCCCRHDVHIIVILIVINIFFSSFNNVDLLCSMSADCCMPQCQEWGTMAALGGLRPPWLACVYFS
jgi:hypothetical protein